MEAGATKDSGVAGAGLGGAPGGQFYKPASVISFFENLIEVN
jgi:hypothetical protein